jgi:hypothetical protein
MATQPPTKHTTAKSTSCPDNRVTESGGRARDSSDKPVGFEVLVRRSSWSPQSLAQQVETRFKHVILEGFGVGEQYFDR